MTRAITSVLFLGKRGNERCAAAGRRCEQLFGNSGLCRRQCSSGPVWPSTSIRRHPSTPVTGCVNFPLYDGVSTYGAACHHMLPAVDSGPIIKVSRSPVSPHDDVASLLERTYQQLFRLFHGVVDDLHRGRPLPLAADTWRGQPLRRRDLDALA